MWAHGNQRTLALITAVLTILTLVLVWATLKDDSSESSSPTSSRQSSLGKLLPGTSDSALECVDGELAGVLDADEFAQLADLETADDTEVRASFAAAVGVCLSDRDLAQTLSLGAGISIEEAECVVASPATSADRARCLNTGQLFSSLLEAMGISEAGAACVSNQLVQLSQQVSGLDTSLDPGEQADRVIQEFDEIEQDFAEVETACLSKSELPLLDR